MGTNINHIVIVGGGTAGWLTACILAKQLNCVNSSELTITLIESPDIPTVGVGEGTVPTMRKTLQMIGVSESEFVKQCDVTFKQSIKFVDWLHNPIKDKPHSYHHLFNYPHSVGFDLTPYWLMSDKSHSFAECVSVQSMACDLNLAPKKITQAEYQASLEYAYHLDAGKFGKFLQNHGVSKLGVTHQQSTISKVEIAANGDIAALHTNKGDKVTADLFIDCSGFCSLLLGDALKVKFIDKGDQLIVDNAIAMQVPYADEEREIPPYTIATAQTAGWTWDIGLSKRRGVGYVYSSSHISHDEAENTLRNYVGSEAEHINARRIPMQTGYREKFWHKNCVAIGLAAGFVEPLEATALLIVEATAKLLAEKLPSQSSDFHYAAKSFNNITQYAWDRVIDFIKLHYYISQRTDSQFWLDNTNPSSAPTSLLERLEYWQRNVPTQSDFFSKYEVFQLENYQYVLYGMEFFTDINIIEQRYPHMKRAQMEFGKLQQQANAITKQLDTHRHFINKVKQYGLSKI